MEWAIGIGGLIIVSVLTWTFLWGKKVGWVDTKIKVIENKLSNPQILPECNEIFTEIKENLSNLTGKVDIILLTMRENQKNNEKKYIQK